METCRPVLAARAPATDASWLARGAHLHFADEALRSLGHQHSHGVSYVGGLEHPRRILSDMRRELGLHRPRTYCTDANAVPSQVLTHAGGQPHQAPFRRAIDSAAGKRILARQRADVHDVARSATYHLR